MTSQRTADERLRLFIERVDLLKQRRAVRDGTISSWFEATFDQTGTTSKYDIGDEEGFRSLLLDVRKFFLQREDVSFNRIANDLGRRLTDDDLQQANQINRETWKKVMAGSFVYMSSTRKYEAADMLDLVVNGEWFHLDHDLESEFQAMSDFTKGMALATVSGLVIDCVKVLFAHANLVRNALQDGHLKPDDSRLAAKS